VIVDTSALVAIVRGESEADQCMAVMRRASARRISAGNLLETYMVIDGAGDLALSDELDADIADLHLTVEPVTDEQVRIAREAFQRYGKGSRHPARLNYGDCFAYALARDWDESLRFIGNDFTHTDVARAL
jgi:ribonuclease VapC